MMALMNLPPFHDTIYRTYTRPRKNWSYESSSTADKRKRKKYSRAL